MMIKYRVREVAKDLNISNKEVIDTLGKYFPEPKKYMTALEENELDIVFETFTQERNLDSFEEYFSKRDRAEDSAPAAKEEPKKEPAEEKPGREDKSAAEQKQGKKPQPQKAKEPAAEKKEQPAAQKAGEKKDHEQKAEGAVSEPKAPTRRVVDTRSSNVNIDKACLLLQDIKQGIKVKGL